MNAPVLDVSDLVVRFGDLVAVDHLSLGADSGEIVGLVGRNGAGKTTTMRALMGITDPDGGAMTWGGNSIGQAERQRFGYMPEERGLYPQMGVRDQLAYFARLHGVERAAARAAAQRWLDKLDLHGRERDKVVELSHGNQQRVQLAAALVHDPGLLVLDEPFAGLDPSAVDVLSEVLREQADRGAAILFSSHQLDLVERTCDRVVIIERGRVLAAGTLAELQARVPAKLRVRVAAPAGWSAGLRGAQVVREDADGVLFDLEPGADPQRVLRAALKAGPVLHFGMETGGLVDLYRRLVR